MIEYWSLNPISDPESEVLDDVAESDLKRTSNALPVESKSWDSAPQYLTLWCNTDYKTKFKLVIDLHFSLMRVNFKSKVSSCFSA